MPGRQLGENKALNLMFKQNNSSVSEKVDEIRAKCGVRLCWIDREGKKRIYLIKSVIKRIDMS